MNDGGVMGPQHSRHGFKQESGVVRFHSNYTFFFFFGGGEFRRLVLQNITLFWVCGWGGGFIYFFVWCP